MWITYCCDSECFGGEDLIEDGITGKIVPIRSPEKIAEKVLCLLNGHLSNAETRQKDVQIRQMPIVGLNTLKK